MVSSNAVSSKVRARKEFHPAIQRIVLLLVITFGLSFTAKPALAATSGGGACPTGNNTIDPEGNPISIANVGVNGTITGGITSCYYISKATGSDSNSGTTEASPWAHLPGMPSCTNTCASTTPAPGNGFILRGGDTWTSSDLGVQWGGWSGTSSHPIYVGVDQSWYNSSCGSSWCRPIFNAQSSVSNNQFNIGNSSWVIFDNIESIGMTNSQNGCQMVGSSNERCTQMYFHAWTRISGPGDNVGFFAQCGSGDMIDHNVMDGSDSSKNTLNGVYGSCAGTVQYNYFNYLVSGILASVDNVNNNIVQNAVTSADGDHCNGIFTFGPQSGKTLYVYNNITRGMQCSGGVNFWLVGNSGGCVGCTSFAYNNIIDASAVSGNVFNIGGHPSDGNTGTYTVENNTIIANNGGTCMGNGESSPRSTTNFANNHCINGSIICDGTGTTCNNLGGNLLQTMSTANKQGYSASELEEYSPVAGCTSSTCSTVGAGVSLASSCSASMTELCSSVTYPSYDSATHRMGVMAANARSAAWDIGAYQFASGSSPNPPTGLSATVQ
ncbi:MAG: hypothetical protein WBM24_14695 [Candidatus Sulfotelmatobacter sp.]